MALAFGWQCLTVRSNYGGHWSALFTTGAHWASPDPEFGGQYIFPGTGYDGQFYRQIAHDPFLRRGLATRIDAPRLRYRRILVPALAYAAALGNPARIDAAYIAAMLGFLFLGVYWAARWAAIQGRHPAWGLALAAIPAAPISLDRMTVDLALAALGCGWALYATGTSRSWKAWAVLAALPLARETGLLLNVASAVGTSEQPWKRRALTSLATLVPCAVWYVYIGAHTKSDPTDWFANLPFAGIASALWRGPAEPAHLALRGLVVALDYAALAGIAVAIALAIRLWLAAPRRAFEIALLLFALLAVQTGLADVWSHVFSFGRVLSPLLLLLGWRALESRKAVLALPLLLILPRVLTQFVPQIAGVARSLR